MYAIRARRKVASEKDFLDAVNKVMITCADNKCLSDTGSQLFAH